MFELTENARKELDAYFAEAVPGWPWLWMSLTIPTKSSRKAATPSA